MNSWGLVLVAVASRDKYDFWTSRELQVVSGEHKENSHRNKVHIIFLNTALFLLKISFDGVSHYKQVRITNRILYELCLNLWR